MHRRDINQTPPVIVTNQPGTALSLCNGDNCGQWRTKGEKQKQCVKA
jgi:hypothetical protein